MPRAVAANLLVRREAFEAVGGFYEGVRAAEDTDFSWRLQRAGWRLEGRPQARVEHRYRTTVRALRRQWRGYAAGRAWLGRRYDGFEPEPALSAGRRPGRCTSPQLAGRRRGRSARPAGHRPAQPPGHRLASAPASAWSAAASWRSTPCWASRSWPGSRSPTGPRRRRPRGPRPRSCWSPTASRPADDPLADFALTLAGARVEAGVAARGARPRRPPAG